MENKETSRSKHSVPGSCGEDLGVQIRPMTEAEYDKVYELWMTIKGFGIRSIDDSAEGVDFIVKRRSDASKAIAKAICAIDGTTWVDEDPFQEKMRTHLVKLGETLSAIAREYGTNYRHLADLNGIPDPNLIHVGQVLKIDGEKSLDDLALEVYRGEWGNGQERKDRLTEAGYDYDAVQDRVNTLYG